MACIVTVPGSGQRVTQDPGLSRELQVIGKMADSDPLMALDRLDLFVKKNSKRIDGETQREVYLLAGRINYNLGQYRLASSNFEKAIRLKIPPSRSSLSKAPGDFSHRTWYDLARAQFAYQAYGAAFESVAEYKRRLRKGEPSERIEATLLEGQILLDSGVVAAATTRLQEARALAEESNDLELRLQAEYALGQAREADEQLDSSLVNYQQAIVYSDSLENDDVGNEITESIGRVYKAKDDVQGELRFKKERRERSVQRNNLTEQNSLGLDIASIYLELDQPEEAIPYLQESVRISEEEGDLQQNIQARKSLSDVYASSGDYTSALENYRNYVALVDQLYDNKEREIALSNEIREDLFARQQTINSLEKDRLLFESEIAFLEKESALQAESLAFQRLSIYGLSLLSLIVFGATVLLYRSNRQKRRSNQLLALKSLRSQMNPHFIFNALNSVNNFISTNDTRQANKYLVDFSKLMRIVMENSQKEFIPFAEEIEVLALYLKLEHFRFQEKFDYELTIDEELETGDFYLPPMIAQPYIENAVWHGLRYKEEKGHLLVNLKLDNDELLLEIEDDGIGRERSLEMKTANQLKTESTGMKNTQGRIDLLNRTYQTNIQVEVQDLEQGTKIRIRIPKSLIEREE